MADVLMLERCQMTADEGDGLGASPSSADVGELTGDDLNVLRVAATGASRTEIASHLHLTPAVVLDHQVAVMRKLGVSSKLAALVVALNTGLIERPASGG